MYNLFNGRGCFKKIRIKKGNSRIFSKRKQYLAHCADDNCKITAHTCTPKESKINAIPEFAGMSCSDITHHPKCKHLFTIVTRKRKEYSKSIKSHQVIKDLENIYTTQPIIMQTGGRPKGKTARRTISITPIQQHHSTRACLG